VRSTCVLYGMWWLQFSYFSTTSSGTSGKHKPRRFCLKTNS
jgi:hypothetical protein